MNWDLFLSHASEDKDFAAPLAQELESRGLRIWYDDAVLRIGQSLRRAIDEGLRQSRFGVVIISPSFLAKEWPQKELDGLVARESDGTPVILPVWHKIDATGVRRYSPMLSDRFAASSSLGVAKVADAIVAAISGGGHTSHAPKAEGIPETIAQLSLEDSRILRIACERIRQTDKSLIRPEEIEEQAAALGISRELLLDSIEILDSEGLVEKSGALGKRVVYFKVKPKGFGIYARQFIPNYTALRDRIAHAIVDKDIHRSSEIAEAVEQDEVTVKFILREFQDEGALTLSNETDRHKTVGMIHPKLKRMANR